MRIWDHATANIRFKRLTKNFIKYYSAVACAIADTSQKQHNECGASNVCVCVCEFVRAHKQVKQVCPFRECTNEICDARNMASIQWSLLLGKIMIF